MTTEHKEAWKIMAMQPQKQAGALDELKGEFDFILGGLKQNHISKAQLGRSAAIGALLSGFAGAGIGAATGKKGKKTRRAIIGALLGAIPGAAIGPAVAQYKKYMAGVPFNNTLKIDDVKPGQKIRIGVAGSANGENESWFADEMRKRFPGSNYMLRHVDEDKLEDIYKKLKAKGADITVIGHSHGGKPAAAFLRKHPELMGYLIDPVSWFGRDVPKNSVVFTSDKSTRHGGPFENTIADMGGRWNYEGPNSVVYKGSHSNRIHHILRDYVAREVPVGGDSPSWADYVTSSFGKAK